MLPDDGVLVARVRGGDEVAYEMLFRTWHGRLMRFGTALLGDAAAAEEVVQTVFARIWQNRATFTVESSLRAYLYTAVRNGALNRFARQRTETEGQPLAAEEERSRLEAAQVPSPLASLEAGEVAAVVRRALETLPARRREVLLLRWQHGLTHAEIARTLGISVKGVENHITRALRSLREELGGEDPR